MNEKVTDKVFSDLKEAAINVWTHGYSDQHGYVTGKIEQINLMENISDNYYTFIGMFDQNNKREMLRYVSEPESKEIVQYFIDEDEKALSDLREKGIFL